MDYNELFKKLMNSDESSWNECMDKNELRYILKNDIRISICFPEDDYEDSYYSRAVTNPSHILNKNMLFKDDLQEVIGYIQYDGVNIMRVKFYYDKGNALYIPYQSEELMDEVEYYTPRWASDLAWFMSRESSYYFNKLESLEIKIEEVAY